MITTIDVLLAPDHLLAALRGDVAAGLSAPPGRRWLPPKWFYDERGSQLFDEITRLPEYYPTRCERAILQARAEEIMAGAATGAAPATLIELGSGTSDKTRLLLDAGTGGGALHTFVPFDVSEETLRRAAAELAARYQDAGLDVHALVGDFERHLGVLKEVGEPGRRLVAFLGGTIGNFDAEGRAIFLGELAAALSPGDGLLLGTDLVKDRDLLLLAYDDPRGVTAQFNRNVLAVINHQLGADFDLGAFAHVAVWDETEEWIEMRLRSQRQQTVSIADLDMVVSFEPGEEIRTEISAKFRRRVVAADLAAAGFELVRWWTDPGGDFAVSLSRIGR
ncbi:MAG TPA: L-histidine N(alpha)-methyltransferase [Acidimicrobiales bacterium]|nr:L-histidine N(alpha)-methyltransferase [Acidimicrobiales bacterium]